MAKARKILQRKKAIQSIHTVTSTMEMVATARFKKSYNRCINARDYIRGVNTLVAEILQKCDQRKFRNEILLASARTNQQATRVIIAITSDRGLCGGFNQGILKLAKSHINSLPENQGKIKLILIGKKGNQLAPSQNLTPSEIHLADDFSNWHPVNKLSESLLTEFISGHIQSVDIIYSGLIGTGKNEPKIAKILPIKIAGKKIEDDFSEYYDSSFDMLDFIPSEKVMLDRLLPMQLKLKFLECFTETQVTEQIARMTAMRAASESADDMIRSLTITYNRTRQAQITTELTEIIGGRAGLD